MYQSIVGREMEWKDSRVLSMRINYFSLTLEEAQELLCRTVDFFDAQLQDNFLSKWGQLKGFTSLKAIREKARSGNYDPKEFIFFFEGYARSPYIYNQSTLRQYRKMIRVGLSPGGNGRIPSFRDGRAPDFPAQFDAFFPELPMDADQLKEKLLAFFRMPRPSTLGRPKRPDLCGDFRMEQDRIQPELFNGHINISALYDCIQDHFAEKLTEWETFAQTQAAILDRLNAQIFMDTFRNQLVRSTHMAYFNAPKNDLTADQRNQVKGEQLSWFISDWLWSVCLWDTAWLSILSPHMRPFLPKEMCTSGVAVEIKPNGGMCIRVQKEIDRLETQDLLPIKRLLDNILYPGCGGCLLSDFNSHDPESYIDKPRCCWELMPLLEHDFTVTETRIQFQHKNYGKIPTVCI